MRKGWDPINWFNSSIRVTTKLPNTEQSSKGKGKTHNQQTDKISQQPENWENCIIIVPVASWI